MAFLLAVIHLLPASQQTHFSLLAMRETTPPPWCSTQNFSQSPMAPLLALRCFPSAVSMETHFPWAECMTILSQPCLTPAEVVQYCSGKALWETMAISLSSPKALNMDS